MRNPISFLAVVAIIVCLTIIRFLYIDKNNSPSLKVTTWDALGYFMYLPANHLYKDEKKLLWLDTIDKKYNLSGGTIYQASKHKNGHMVFKYLRGVSLLQMPFYFLAHAYALNSQQFPADGFSAPYQYAIAFGLILFISLSFFLLRHVLLKYFKDSTVACGLLLLILASNAIQYISIDSGQSHGWIFPLYVFILYLSIQWHEKKHWLLAFFIGFTIGLASISRPTEAIMLFIPLLWHCNDKVAWKEKWQFIKTAKLQWVAVLAGGLLGIAPQLIYWKRITGSWVYDVGSKWDFLQPHIQVLIGWEKGWFIYTPVTILFILGMFYLKDKTFKSAIITFCLLNIYIIISWHIWRYGASYSARALVQSYPIFALPLCSFIEHVSNKKWRLVLIPIGLFLIGNNLFQIYQYNANILHYDEMNRKYYSAIYLNPSPNALDMSLLDTDDYICDEHNFKSRKIYSSQSTKRLQTNTILYADSLIPNSVTSLHYLKVNATIQSFDRIWGRYIHLIIEGENKHIEKKIRLFHALAREHHFNQYSFFIKLPVTHQVKYNFKMMGDDYIGELKQISIEYLYK